MATFVVAPPRRPVTARSSHTETQVIDLWKAQAANAQREAKTYLDSQGFDRDLARVRDRSGPDWGRAIRMLDWEDGDILAVGCRRRIRWLVCSSVRARPRSSGTRPSQSSRSPAPRHKAV